MENFTFENPTRLHFGRGQIARLAEELPSDARVLLLAGGGSIRKNGVHEQVREALGGRHVAEFFGVEANPDFDTLMRAVELGIDEKVDWILPVGGGSVLDGAKFVAAAIPFRGDPWEIVRSVGSAVETALPIGAVLTLPATGSEANGASVISRRATGQKLHFWSRLVYPRFSVLDPETTYSLPPRQVANGVVDAFVHVVEQYLTYPARAAVQDGFAEAILRVLIEEGPRAMEYPEDYDTRANLVWAATCALNGFIGVGVPQDWATHMIGHELTALHGIDHARTLAIVLPSLLAAQRPTKHAKLLQYAERVWDLREGDEEARVDEAIARTRAFFESLGVETRLSAYAESGETPKAVADRLAARGMNALGEHGDLDPERVEALLAAAV
jgi:NADP-dependent alcohol dehydrogenase